MRRHVTTAWILAALITVVATGASGQSDKKPLRLPFPYIFSGPLIEFGERVWNEGVVPAVEEVNKRGGIKGRPLEFYKVDVRFPETAPWISEFRRLCADLEVPIVFGIGPTKSLLAIYEDIAKCKVPVFNPSAGGEWPHKDFAGFIFRYQPMPADVMPILLARAKDRFQIKTAALTFTVDDDFAVNNAKVSKKILGDLGIRLVAEQSFKTKETNFASQVAAIRAGKPDAIVMHHQPGDAGTMLLQLRQRGVTGPVLSDILVGGADFWKLSEGKALGAIGFAVYAADDPRPVVQDWVSMWRTLTRRPTAAPDGFVTTYYDAVQVLAQVLNKSRDLSREAIRDAFLQVRDAETISGAISWKEVGDVTRRSPVLVEVGENGVLKHWK
jgi:branched-chain amino acid transport system substrate-binding protein